MDDSDVGSESVDMGSWEIFYTLSLFYRSNFKKLSLQKLLIKKSIYSQND